MMQKKSPSIDILLPYWGDFSLFKETVDSVIAQTNPSWRMIIADDCYPSGAAQKYITTLNDPRITYIRHKKNIGITNNFNFLIKKASAEFCVIPGCDDRFLPDYIEHALIHMSEDVDFYQPYVEVIDANGNVCLPLGDRIKRMLQPKRSGLYSGEKLACSLTTGNWLYFPSITWRTSTIKNVTFDDHYKIVQDVALELGLILKGSKMYFDRTTTFQYRRSSESLSSKEKKGNGIRFIEESQVYDDFAKKFEMIGWRFASRASRARITSRIHKLLSWC